MKSGRRLAMAIWAAGLALGPIAARAQSTDAQPGSAAPADTVGPRDLQNFSLSGTVTKRPEEPASGPSAPATSANPVSTATAVLGDSAPPVHSARRAKAPQNVAPHAVALVPSPLNAARQPESAPVRPPAINAVRSPASSVPSVALAPVTAAAPMGDGHRLLLWPWFLAFCVLAGGLALLIWRNRQSHAFAGGLEFEAYAAPETAPKAQPAPSPPETPALRNPAPSSPAPPPVSPPQLRAGSGIVASRLRPWIELGIQPLRCVVEDHQVVVEFELELFNSGNAPARAVLVEASIFNAGPTQDEEIGAFIAQPIGAGERLDAIAPLQTVSLRTQVVAPRTSVQVLELAGRQLFVPLIAFNTLYRWSGGEGQTSMSYLLGRDTKADKLAPFRLDLGPRVFRGLGARPLPLGERR